MRVLVTGSDGWLGQRMLAELSRRRFKTRGFDLPLSVLNRVALARAASGCDFCVHLAAHKYAALGEDEPADVAEVNILGTRNVVDLFGSELVLASTCKAADPFTVYGATKFAAERVVLNAGGRVVRLVNVWGSSGSVSQLWDRVPEHQALPVVTEAERLWMSGPQAVGLLLDAVEFPSGRYAPAVGQPVDMAGVARQAFPGREQVSVPLRRGDRPRERLVAEYESAAVFRPGVLRIGHPSDLGSV